MAQILDPLPPDSTNPVVCCYVNATSKIQVARITNIPNWYFERVVFPGQRLIFEALPTALLEIHTGMMASAILSDTIACSSLAIQDEAEAEVDADIAASRDRDSQELVAELTTVMKQSEQLSLAC
ncbi:DUF1830 domain-containing protein [Trichothermofontia sichuanensis B231]|uniref:DUF1830 domain-containing protein n=1 Tax=Trichothermofontia sichuanensis TaxID=3045816 RepID=UPI002246B235|nr:DUF1830 domain-containing protein [Trichothermofontia sichuanensis]UZQ53820.1 DUF1830 domain-containing protein [Trichothermofontia sichuanensis B231]